MLFCCTPSNAETVEIDGIYYELLEYDPTKAKVTYKGNYPSEYDEYKGDIIIPDDITYDGETYHVEFIGAEAFAHCSSLTSVRLGGAIWYIEGGAFKECSALGSIISKVLIMEL